MKTNQPLIDLCFYAETDLNLWLSHNPLMRQTTQLLDADGYHVLFRCKGVPPAIGAIKNGGKEIGYWATASPEMADRVAEMEAELRDRQGRN